jgi:tetrahydromethanopterin S-methyltransferase subunit G
MANNFVSNENKAFIWQILMEANAFNNISNSKFQQINLSYETIISEISKNTGMSLIEKNKLLMSKMLELLKHLKYESQHTRLQNVDIKVDLQKGETDYIKIVNHNKPKDISFNEEIDKPFDPSELNTKLNEIVAARSYDNPSSIINKSSDKKVGFSSILETIPEKDSTNEKVYTLLQTIAADLKISINKQDLIIEMLNRVEMPNRES